ncbi:MAG: hypothetical protein ACJ70N_04465, partial [Nitrososphaera sp.]
LIIEANIETTAIGTLHARNRTYTMSLTLLLFLLVAARIVTVVLLFKMTPGYNGLFCDKYIISTNCMI